MKACILALSSPNDGGMFHYSIYLVKGLSKYCKLLVVAPLESLNYYSGLKNIDVFILKKSSRIFLFLYILKLRKVLKNFDNVIIHDPIGTSKIIKPLIAKLIMYKSVPILTTIHDVKLHSGLSSFFNLLHRIATKITILLSDYIIVHDKISKKIIEEKFNYPTERIFVVPIGAYDIFCENVDITFPERANVLFFGELRYNKGVDRLIQIAEIVKKEIDNVCFIVAGNPKVIAQHSLAEAGIVNRSLEKMKKLNYFKVIGKYIPDNEVKNLFLNASVVILPYRDATQSGIVGIAYAFARPVVATKVGGLPDLIIDGETGYLTKTNTDEEIAECVIKLLKDKELYIKMCKNAFQLYRTKLSWDSVSHQIFELYKKILNTNYEN